MGFLDAGFLLPLPWSMPDKAEPPESRSPFLMMCFLPAPMAVTLAARGFYDFPSPAGRLLRRRRGQFFHTLLFRASGAGTGQVPAPLVVFHERADRLVRGFGKQYDNIEFADFLLRIGGKQWYNNFYSGRRTGWVSLESGAQYG